jgi:poly(3-hydroxybutyrate) depolymerase
MRKQWNELLRTSLRYLSALAVFFVAISLPTLHAQTCSQDTYNIGAETAKFKICLPPTEWNDLVIYAHGYVSPELEAPLEVQDDVIAGTPVSAIITSLGFAFATSSYRRNGLVVHEAVDDLVALAGFFASHTGRTPRQVYLVGASEGGLVTALAMERHPEIFNGGLAACGPVGDLHKQLLYFGDFLVLFNYFFPGMLPGVTPSFVPAGVMEGWSTVFAPAILGAVASAPSKTAQLLRVAGVPYDSGNPASIGATVVGLLWYNVFATNDAVSTLGGSPYDNRLRWYFGSSNDLTLNWKIPRYAADPTALANLEKYKTRGRLSEPLVTLHTTKDPIVPYWHEPLYRLKTIIAGSALRHLNIPVSRIGHCQFTQQEVLAAFAFLLFMAGAI